MKKFLRLRAAKDWTGLSRSTIYAMMKNGTFPKSISLGARAIGWLESDIQAWIDSRISASKVEV
ncbi:MAG: AlpA family transcriptional regulator [Methylotenera sp.]|nr:AlpA family transcriptional regulator [Methylotenera sp.]MDO9389756.1 AlpA family transcriptional regulator [Methylotenera sp.]MDP2101294.1 AlpA family transcriptional regulator [Methylotenera sp.]MDP2281759.1 AlpA family transcriptional regulator [Methylotenera sp.]MDP3059295.1 AlpA family transcriptional regulator [Methylotenera sp.]